MCSRGGVAEVEPRGLKFANPNEGAEAGGVDVAGGVLAAGGWPNIDDGAGDELATEEGDGPGFVPKPEKGRLAGATGEEAAGAVKNDDFVAGGAAAVGAGDVEAGGLGAENGEGNTVDPENREGGLALGAAIMLGVEVLPAAGDPALTGAAPPFAAPKNEPDGFSVVAGLVSFFSVAGGFPNPKNPVVAGLATFSDEALDVSAGALIGASLESFGSFSRVTGGLASGELRRGAEPNGLRAGLLKPNGDGVGGGADLGGAGGGEADGDGDPGGVLLSDLGGSGSACTWGSGLGDRRSSKLGLGTGILDGASLAGFAASIDCALGFGGVDEAGRLSGALLGVSGLVSGLASGLVSGLGSSESYTQSVRT
ncbi:hypothetical protein AG1IA_05248 [Rhizoctonia solani AG-1 IA]|uniref:Uncharacterized protein n=1 Tax=Thanatephorus cucumeris (strain AG1-IA) TaxID=983506 RepID=L8WRW9_THACA|nr:hypothetical protein AG1IA_05248 [Rhizoctonia solani AG-1 IA]